MPFRAELGFVDLPVGVDRPDVFRQPVDQVGTYHSAAKPHLEEPAGFQASDDPQVVTDGLPWPRADWRVEAVVGRMQLVVSRAVVDRVFVKVCEVGLAKNGPVLRFAALGCCCGTSSADPLRSAQCTLTRQQAGRHAPRTLRSAAVLDGTVMLVETSTAT